MSVTCHYLCRQCGEHAQVTLAQRAIPGGMRLCPKCGKHLDQADFQAAVKNREPEAELALVGA